MDGRVDGRSICTYELDYQQAKSTLLCPKGAVAMDSSAHETSPSSQLTSGHLDYRNNRSSSSSLRRTGGGGRASSQRGWSSTEMARANQQQQPVNIYEGEAMVEQRAVRAAQPQHEGPSPDVSNRRDTARIVWGRRPSVHYRREHSWLLLRRSN